MKKISFCLFDTPLGCCGIAWSEAPGAANAVRFFQLPEGNAGRTEARLVRGAAASRVDSPPPAVAELIARVGRHLAGETQDFRDVRVELDGIGPFARAVYDAARAIPAGQTRTYGELARAVGRPGAARAVGQALGKNPVALIIPCHRVLAAGNKPGGFSAAGGLALKARMLAVEGAAFRGAGLHHRT